MSEVKMSEVKNVRGNNDVRGKNVRGKCQRYLSKTLMYIFIIPVQNVTYV